jgi:uncharacterized membrane protein YfcA
MGLGDVLLLACITLVSFTLAFYGAAVGLILGHLRLPLLSYYLRSSAAASATNLAISGLGAMTGTIRHLRGGRVSTRVLAIMGIPSILGALFAGIVLVKCDSSLVRIFVGGFLVLSGINLLRKEDEGGETAQFGLGLRLILEVIIGLGLGFLAVVTGLMMGSMRLPMMIKWLRIDSRVAVGSNMAIGFLTALAGSVTLWIKGSQVGSFAWLPLVIVAPPTVIGGYLGARWTGYFKKESLQRLVGWTIAATGAFMATDFVWMPMVNGLTRSLHS